MSEPRPQRRESTFERKGGYPSGTKPVAELPKIPRSAQSPRSAPRREEANK